MHFIKQMAKKVQPQTVMSLTSVHSSHIIEFNPFECVSEIDSCDIDFLESLH